MTNESIKTYQYRITQATASQLIVIMYDMAIEYLRDAREADDAANIKNNIYMAERVVDKLMVNLDMQYEISKNLFVIYNHIKRSLIAASVSTDRDELDRVSGLLKKLRTAFYEVSKQDNSAPLMRNTQAVYSGLTYSKAGASNETRTADAANRGFRV